MGNDLRTQIKACVCKPNPMHIGFDLHTHAYGTHTQGCSKP